MSIQVLERASIRRAHPARALASFLLGSLFATGTPADPAAERAGEVESPAPGGLPETASAEDRQVEEAARRVIAENVRALIAAGALERAADEAERLVHRAPESLEARLLAVEVYYRLGRDADLERHAAVARDLDPASAEADHWLARLARWRGRLEEARRHLRRALERQPDSPTLLANLAALHAAEGRARPAERLYRRALAAGLEHPATALDAALALRDPAERHEALHGVAERFPDYSPGRAWAALSEAIPAARWAEADPWAGPLEVPLILERQHFPLVEADLGEGVRVRLLLDTGSAGLKISRPVAERLGLRPFGSLQVGGLGSGRSVRSDLVLVDRLRVGELLLRRVPASVLDSLPLGDGLLNPKALGAEAVRLDVSRQTLVLGDNEVLAAADAPRLSFVNLDQHPLVRLFLNGRARLAMIDSGSGATVLDESVVRQIPDRRPMLIEGIDFSLSGVLGEVRDARPVHVARLRLGAVDLENPLLFEADLSRFGEVLGTEVQMLFGADFLSRFDATFDYRNMEIVLEPATRRKGGGLRPGS